MSTTVNLEIKVIDEVSPAFRKIRAYFKRRTRLHIARVFILSEVA